MMIQVQISDLIYMSLTLGAGFIVASWAVMARLVFKPLDLISKDIKSMKNFMEPKIIRLEAEVNHLKTKCLEEV